VQTFIKAIPGLLIVLVVAGLGALLLGQVGAWFFSLEQATMTASASLVAVLLVPVITYFTAKSLEQRKSRENAIRERKTAFYDKLITDLVGMLPLGVSKKAMSAAEMQDVFGRIPAPLLTFGSRGVIRAWNEFRKVSREQGDDSKAIIVAFEGLLKAMRKDLGHPVWSHQNGELIGVFVNDPETVFARKGKAKVAPQS
jgi:hypothetical protein